MQPGLPESFGTVMSTPVKYSWRSAGEVTAKLLLLRGAQLLQRHFLNRIFLGDVLGGCGKEVKQAHEIQAKNGHLWTLLRSSLSHKHNWVRSLLAPPKFESHFVWF